MTYDQAQSPRLGQRTAVESTYVQIFDVDPGTDTPDLVEAAWPGQLIYRLDTHGLQIYNGIENAWETVGSGNFTYVSSVMPPGTDYKTGDVWYDTSNNYQLNIWDESIQPDGAWAITAEQELVTTMITSETLTAGDLVNIYNAGSVAMVRQANAAAALNAHGFVTDSYPPNAPAKIYFGGLNPLQSGLVPGTLWLSTTPGRASNTPPSSVGSIVQRVGPALNDHTMEFLSLLAIKII